VPNESALFLNHPTEIWNIILHNLNDYDAIFVRATSKRLFNLVKELRPFPKYFVLAHGGCMEYLIENGYISCIDYVKTALNFDWKEVYAQTAAISGQVDTLKFLLEKGVPLDAKAALLDSRNTCELATIKYLLETCISWDKLTENEKRTVVANMAKHGHIECLKYVIRLGNTPKKFSYTPTIECLEFAIENDFDWKGQDTTQGSTPRQRMASAVLTSLLSVRSSIAGRFTICEEAAKHGNLAVLKYAYEKGVALKTSASLAAKEGHVDCLIYAIEHANDAVPPKDIANLQCFQYLLEKFGIEEISRNFNWMYPLSDNSGEYLRFAVSNGVPLPTSGDPLQALLKQAGRSSVENLKFILDKAASARESISLLAGLDTFSYENIQLMLDRNMFKSVDEYDDRDITTAYDNAVSSKDVRIVQLVWEKFQKIHLIREDYVLCVSSPAILDFMAQKGVQWKSEHLGMASNFAHLPNMAFLTRFGCKYTFWSTFGQRLTPLSPQVNGMMFTACRAIQCA
jgi:hypothetical protein